MLGEKCNVRSANKLAPGGTLTHNKPTGSESSALTKCSVVLPLGLQTLSDALRRASFVPDKSLQQHVNG